MPDRDPDPPRHPSRADLASLARRAARGEEEAFAGLDTALRGALRRVFVERGAGRDLADDLAQRTLLGLWQALSRGSYDPTRSAVTTFAYAIAQKVWLQHLRSSGRADAAVDRYTRLVAALPRDPGEGDARQEQDVAALVQAVRDALSDRPAGDDQPAPPTDLTDDERWLLRMWAGGESDRTLAQKLGIAASNVNARKQRAYAKLRAYLGSLGFGPDAPSPTTRPTPGPSPGPTPGPTPDSPPDSPPRRPNTRP